MFKFKICKFKIQNSEKCLMFSLLLTTYCLLFLHFLLSLVDIDADCTGGMEEIISVASAPANISSSVDDWPFKCSGLKYCSMNLVEKFPERNASWCITKLQKPNVVSTPVISYSSMARIVFSIARSLVSA